MSGAEIRRRKQKDKIEIGADGRFRKLPASLLRPLFSFFKQDMLAKLKTSVAVRLNAMKLRVHLLRADMCVQMTVAPSIAAKSLTASCCVSPPFSIRRFLFPLRCSAAPPTDALNSRRMRQLCLIWCSYIGPARGGCFGLSAQ